jgi:hypothetical protein
VGLLLLVALCCWCYPRMRQNTNVVINNKPGTSSLHAQPYPYSSTPPTMMYTNPAACVPPTYHECAATSVPPSGDHAWGTMHYGFAPQPQEAWSPLQTPEGPSYGQYNGEGAVHGGGAPFVMSATGSVSTASTSGHQAMGNTNASSKTRSSGGTWTMQTVPVPQVDCGGPVSTGVQCRLVPLECAWLSGHGIVPV